MMKNIFSFSIVCVMLIIPISIFADEIRVDAMATEAKVGDEFVLDVKVATTNQMNALEGFIDFDPEALSLKEIYSGDSVIQFWVSPPEENGGRVSFSGVSPTGFSGANNQIFRLIMVSKKGGVYTVNPVDMKGYLNDGTGKSIALRIHPVQMTIVGEARPSGLVYQDNDQEPPEDFTPSIVETELISGGNKVLVFSTQDKGVGIASYAIKEGMFDWYKEVKSPYTLKHRDFSRTIYIRVSDKNGNTRTVIVPAKSALYWYQYYETWVVAGICFLFMFFGYGIWKKIAK